MFLLLIERIVFMPRIFLSYRRADSRLVSNRIYDRLVAAFGKQNVFKDVDNIPPGRDFRGVLREATAECQVMLVVIGPNWVNVTDANGNRRLDDPNDFVRIEVETGLQRDGILVIPVLVEGAAMPPPNQLPISLQELAYNNAFTIHDDPLFHRDMDALIIHLRKLLHREGRFSWWLVLATLLLIVVIGVFTLPPLLNRAFPTQVASDFTTSPTLTNTAVEIVSTATLSEPLTTPEATLTPSLTLDIPQIVETLDAQATYDAATQFVRETAAARATSIAVATQSALDATATATLWTATPTPNVTASIEAYRTQQGATATSLYLFGLTATATFWTLTPTPTNTFTPSPTSTPMIFQAQIANSFLGATLRSEPSINASTHIRNISITDSVAGHINVYGMVRIDTRVWYLVVIRDVDTEIS
ncbi:MAG: toll/interleukin-1 receptor domain-containing protein, partial [Chloroflexota bacterium]